MKTSAIYALLFASNMAAAQNANSGIPQISSDLAAASSARAAATTNLANYCRSGFMILDGTKMPYTPSGDICSNYLATATATAANAATSSPSKAAAPAITPFLGAGLAAGVAAALL